jgi:ribosome-associated heat shock protein Hsp15
MRLDIWLDIACLFRTRTEAQKACRAGKITVNGTAGRPHRLLKAGDRIEIRRKSARRQFVVVRGFAERHLPKADARLLYEDDTPAPTPEELELLRMERLSRPRPRPPGAGAPDRRERRELRRLKESG